MLDNQAEGTPPVIDSYLELPDTLKVPLGEVVTIIVLFYYRHNANTAKLLMLSLMVSCGGYVFDYTFCEID
jgi:hypothetical protein